MAAKTNYRVRFFKTVVDDYGSDAEICQCDVPVAAENRDIAAKHGIQRFCRRDRLRDWTDHADRYVVERMPDDGVAAAKRGRRPRARTSGARSAAVDDAQ